MALDSSIPAGMTVFLARQDLCITDERSGVGTGFVPLWRFLSLGV